MRGFIFADGKLLCVKLSDYNEVIKADYWCLPGGGLEFGESLQEGVARELYEELGVQAKVGNLLYVQQFTSDGEEHLEFFFHITNPEDFVDFDLSQTSHGVEEIKELEFVDPKSSYILPRFLSEANIAEDISSAIPQFFSYLSL